MVKSSVVKFSFFLLFVALLCSCRFFERRETEDAAVQIGQAVLTRSEIEEVTSDASDQTDSLAKAEAFIRQWAEDVLFYEKATVNKDARLEQMIEQYRRDLYLHAYEERLVRQKMNHEVSDVEVQGFYDRHSDMFVLEEPLIKGLLLVVPNGTPDMTKLRKWLAKSSEEIENIEKYAYAYATGYELFTDEWLRADAIRQHIPFSSVAELGQALKHKQLIEVTDTMQTYLLQVTDKRLVGEEMPIEYAEKEIKNILLYERQAAFLRAQKATLYKEADMLFRIKRFDKEENE